MCLASMELIIHMYTYQSNLSLAGIGDRDAILA